MLEYDPISALTWLTVARIIVGAGMLFILAGSLYKFKKSILTIMGILMLTNFMCLIVLMGMMT